MLQDHVEDYFKVKRLLKELRADLSDAKKNHELTEEIESTAKKLKKMRVDLMADELVNELKEEVDTQADRMKMLKEVIRQEMVEEETTSVSYDGRVIKLVQVMKEGKDESSSSGNGGGWDRSEIEIDENVEVK